MSVTGVNHLTLAVSNLNHSVDFYRDILGMKLRARWDRGAYLEAGDLWLCLMVSAAPDSIGANDYSHIALNVAANDFGAIAAKLSDVTEQWQDNSSEGDSHYFCDPDGHKLEIHCGSLETRLEHYRQSENPGVQVFDE